MICQRITKKYYATCSVKKKYIDCNDLLPKYNSDCKYHSNLMDFLIDKNYLDCYAKRLLSVQSDFQIQKYEIEEFI